MSAEFNTTQLEILKLLQHINSQQDLIKIKSLFAAYLSDKVVRNADAAFDNNNYTRHIVVQWKIEHFRSNCTKLRTAVYFNLSLLIS